MIYFIWTFAFLFALDLFLCIFFQLKDFGLQKKITIFLLIPFSTALFLSILAQRLPDSIHVIRFLSATSFFCEVALFFYDRYKKNPESEKLLAFTRLSALLTVILWIFLIYSALHLVRIPDWFSWIFVIAFAVFYIVFVFLQHGEGSLFYLYFALVFASTGFLIFTSLAELGYIPSLHSFVAFAGFLMFLSSIILNFSKKRQFTKKGRLFIFELLFIFSQIVTGTAATLMVAG